MGGGEDLTWSVWQTQRGTETIPGEGGGTQMWSWRWWPVDKKGHGVGFDEEKIQMMTIMMIMMSMITLQSLWRRVDRPLPRDNTLDVRPLLRERSRNYIKKVKQMRERSGEKITKNTFPCLIFLQLRICSDRGRPRVRQALGRNPYVRATQVCAIMSKGELSLILSQP